MRLEARLPLKVKIGDRELLLDPGQPIDLPDAQAEQLLRKAPDAVRIVNDVILEPGPCRPVFWEGDHGVIRAGVAELLGLTRDPDGAERFWVFIGEKGDGARWVHESRLRSKAEYEAQRRKNS